MVTVKPHFEYIPEAYFAKGRYCSRLWISSVPKETSFGENRWITSEDVNIEHLLGIFASVDANSENVWEACANFAKHLSKHKPRLVTLASNVEVLPDNHPSKPRCLSSFSELFDLTGRYPERKRSLTHTLRLDRERGDDPRTAMTLSALADVNQDLDLLEEGILQLKEVLEIYERCSDIHGQKVSLYALASLFIANDQPGAAEETISRAIKSLPPNERNGPCDDYQPHHITGRACQSRGETEAAISHFEQALVIGSPSSSSP